MSMISQYDGTCAKDKSHTWKVGQQIFYQKSPKCICINKDCFDKQVAAAKQPQEPAKDQKSAQVSDISIEKSLARAKAFDDYAWKLALEHAKTLYPDGAMNTIDQLTKERAIATESIYHTLVEAYNGAR